LVSKVFTSWWSTNHENSSSRQEPEGHAEWTGRGGSRTFDRGGPGDGGDGMEPGPVDEDKGDPDGADPVQAAHGRTLLAIAGALGDSSK
jgi:hypothetical protein